MTRPRIFRHDATPDAPPAARWGGIGLDALGRADAALAAGDKAGALRDYAVAYGALRTSHMTTAPAAKLRAANAILALIEELGGEAFGTDLCSHGQSKNLVCWACSDERATQVETAYLVKTEPTTDDINAVFGFRSRAADAEIIRDVDDALLKKAGG